MSGAEKDDALLDEIRRLVREEVRAALCSVGPAKYSQEDERSVLRGDLRYFRLPELLHMVALQGMTGRLSMSSDSRHVDIYMRNGEVAFATDESRGAAEHLGFLLVNMGRLSKGSLDTALARCAETGARLGGVLVEDGLVSEADIHSALMKQTERSVYKAMAWGEGEFSFVLCTMPEFIEDIPLGLKVEGLILEGVRRVEELRAVSEKIHSLDMVFTRPAYAPEEIGGMKLKSRERRVLELVDGERDVRGLIKASGLGELELLRALYALYSAGIIMRKGGTAVKADRTQYL